MLHISLVSRSILRIRAQLTVLYLQLVTRI